ncbi:MAG: site-specific integrase [Hyphomonas sp.]|nr:site-specific integrase [Hyphomonas sp.]
MAKLTKTIVENAATRDRQFTLWCDELKGFGVFINPGGSRSYFVDYRNESGVRRRMTIGRHGKITAEQARRRAIGMLGQTVQGADPAAKRVEQRKSISVKELCEQYLDAAEKGLVLGKGGRPKKASTLDTDRGRINCHINPLLGSRRVKDLQTSDINKFLRDVAVGKTATVRKTGRPRGKAIVTGGLGTAGRTTGLLGGILSYAVSEGIIESNPAHGVKRPANKRRQRRLTPEEYRKLGDAIAVARNTGEVRQAIDGALLLALTGCRLGEIVSLRWDEIDEAGGCFRLKDSKEGASVRPVGKRAFDVLGGIEPMDNFGHVLVAERYGVRFGGMPRAWKRIVKRAALEDVTPHTLRHSYASVAGDMGYSEPTIAALLGHAAGSVTSRYVHHLDSVLIAAADKVAGHIAKLMFDNPIALIDK